MWGIILALLVGALGAGVGCYGGLYGWVTVMGLNPCYRPDWDFAAAYFGFVSAGTGALIGAALGAALGANQPKIQTTARWVAVGLIILLGVSGVAAASFNAWRPYWVARYHGPSAVLFYADLRRANLRSANLHGAMMQNANLSGAILTEANLQDADLNEVNFTGADLREANLHGAFPEHADFTDADLRKANLVGADLTGASLSGTRLNGVQYDRTTRWPRGFDPTARAAQRAPAAS